MKLSFKREAKETGLRAIANPNPNVQIKANKQRIGMIYAPSRFGGDFWTVNLAVKKERTPEHPAPFGWVSFKFKGHTEDEAREFVTKYWEHFVSKYDFHNLDS